MERLNSDFFTQDAYTVAKQLIGKYICRNIDGEIKKFKITETECYIGTDDTACHASKGKTARTQIMWAQGGVCYVYLCYGMHNMLNFVTGQEGSPEAVLIRGVEGSTGPGRATKAMKTDRSFNGKSVLTDDDIWLESDGKKYSFIEDKRVGIGYASRKDQDRLWRFIIK